MFSSDFCHSPTPADYLLYTNSIYPAQDPIEPDLKGKDPVDNDDESESLFLERLDKFLDGQSRDIENFANREGRPLLEIRQRIAIIHAKFLFARQDPSVTQSDPSIPSVAGTMNMIMRSLNTLHDVSGHDSLIVVVSPKDNDPESVWVGGTEAGQQFWKSLKGVAGAKILRQTCKSNWESRQRKEEAFEEPKPAISKSMDIKAELNAAVRNALREVSGDPTAQMRWTKPSNLDYNGVLLVGWPEDIKMKNPSNNSLKDNKRLLEMVKRKEIRFVKKGPSVAATLTERPAIYVESTLLDSSRPSQLTQAGNAPGGVSIQDMIEQTVSPQDTLFAPAKRKRRSSDDSLETKRKVGPPQT